jgi:hypothetical protein
MRIGDPLRSAPRVVGLEYTTLGSFAFSGRRSSRAVENTCRGDDLMNVREAEDAIDGKWTGESRCRKRLLAMLIILGGESEVVLQLQLRRQELRHQGKHQRPC